MEKSIFTKIIKREIPGQFVFEDDRVVVLMDKFPAMKGQTLVIPKDQVDYLFDLPDDLYAHLWNVAKKTAQAMDAALKPRRVCVVVEGFEVPHVHIRMYPVPENEPLRLKPTAMEEDDALTELAETIKAHLT